MDYFSSTIVPEAIDVFNGATCHTEEDKQSLQVIMQMALEKIPIPRVSEQFELFLRVCYHVTILSDNLTTMESIYWLHAWRKF